MPCWESSSWIGEMYWGYISWYLYLQNQYIYKQTIKNICKDQYLFTKVNYVFLQIWFEGTTGPDSKGDIGLDLIRLQKGLCT